MRSGARIWISSHLSVRLRAARLTAVRAVGDAVVIHELLRWSFLGLIGVDLDLALEL